MKGIRISILMVIIAVLFVASGCSTNESVNESGNGDKLKVITTIAQIADPIREIGKDIIEVTSLMGPGVDPHLYQATTGDITKLESSDVILYNGLHLEASMLEVFEQMSKSKTVVAIGEEVDENLLLKDETGAVDPHIWFDVSLWKQALDAAVEEIAVEVPEHKEQLEKNKEEYFQQLDQLEQESKTLLASIPENKRILVTAHDAFGYFGASNQITVVGLQGLSTESELSLNSIQETIALLKQYEVPAVFIESSINPDSIQAVIEGAAKEGLNVTLGGELFSDAMGAEGTVEGTYIGMYKHNVDVISQALLGKGE